MDALDYKDYSPWSQFFTNAAGETLVGTGDNATAGGTGTGTPTGGVLGGGAGGTITEGGAQTRDGGQTQVTGTGTATGVTTIPTYTPTRTAGPGGVLTNAIPPGGACSGCGVMRCAYGCSTDQNGCGYCNQGPIIVIPQYGTLPAPSQRSLDVGGGGFGGGGGGGSSSGEEEGLIEEGSENIPGFNWILLVLVGAGIYFLSKQKGAIKKALKGV